MTDQFTPTSYKLVRNAHVEVQAVHSMHKGKVHVQADITVVDENDNVRNHRFPSHSRVSEHLQMMTPNQLQSRLEHGTFMFLDGDDGSSRLVDFRGGQYNGFIHTDDTIREFADRLGFTPITDNGNRFHANAARQTTNLIRDIKGKSFLGRPWSSRSVDVQSLKDGGSFQTDLIYQWSPFVQNVQSDFRVVRLICTNGMIGATSLFKAQIPLFNRWEEHLHIASRQLHDRMDSYLDHRVTELTKSRATVLDCLRIADHLTDRLAKAVDVNDKATHAHLLSLLSVCSPIEHLGHVYREDVFTNRALAGKVPSHLSAFDVWNISTETNTHSGQTSTSSAAGVNKLALDLMFNRNFANERFHIIDAKCKLSDASNAEQAFFSAMS